MSQVRLYQHQSYNPSSYYTSLPVDAPAFDSLPSPYQCQALPFPFSCHFASLHISNPHFLLESLQYSLAESLPLLFPLLFSSFSPSGCSVAVGSPSAVQYYLRRGRCVAAALFVFFWHMGFYSLGNFIFLHLSQLQRKENVNCRS